MHQFRPQLKYLLSTDLYILMGIICMQKFLPWFAVEDTSVRRVSRVKSYSQTAFLQKMSLLFCLCVSTYRGSNSAQSKSTSGLERGEEVLCCELHFTHSLIIHSLEGDFG